MRLNFSLCKYTGGQNNLYLLGLKTTYIDFKELKIISLSWLKPKHFAKSFCNPNALGAKRQISSAYIT